MTTSIACPHCGTNPRGSHSLKLAGICDGIRAGKVRVVSSKPLTVADADGTLTVYNPNKKDRHREAE
jgi:hypothetical protein